MARVRALSRLRYGAPVQVRQPVRSAASELRSLLKAMVLYVFEVAETDFVKLGYTSGGACVRRLLEASASRSLLRQARLGRPTARVSPGTLDDKAAIQQQLPPERGEFWPREQLDAP